MKISKLKQGTIEWLNAKVHRIGASEAYAIIRQYASCEELLAAGLDPESVRDEIPYESAYAIYNRIVNGVYLPKISLWDDLYGKAVEDWFRAQFTVAPKPLVYTDSRHICSLDGINGAGYPGIPDGAVIEIKSRRGQLESKIKNSWIIQNNLQCAAAGNENGFIAEICLEDWTENMRGAVAKMYQMLSKKKFREWFSGVPKKVNIIENKMNPRIIALWNLCSDRFWADVESRTPPIPQIAEEKSRSGVMELLASYDGFANYDLSLLEFTKKQLSDAKKAVDAETQRIFEFCVRNQCATLYNSESNGCKKGSWSAAGSFLLSNKKD